MPSPFPGMDPWLEGEHMFPNLHDRLIIYAQDVLNAALPAGYVATTKNRVWVDAEARRDPDVSVLGPDTPSKSGTAVAALPGLTMLGAEPTPDPWEEPYLEIRSGGGKRLVTAIEVVSPSNKKAGRGRRAYREKQREFRKGRVNVVEIDLLRRGPHSTAIPLATLRRLGPFDYHVGVVVASRPRVFHATGVRLADRLPVIGVPLDPGVPPATLDLQSLLDRAYDGGRYTELFRYVDPPDPPLTPEQAAWAEGILREKGLVK
jgi:hypothetical protein